MEEKNTPNQNEVTTPQEETQETRLPRLKPSRYKSSSGSSSNESDVQEVGSNESQGKGSSSSSEHDSRTAGKGTGQGKVKKESLSENSSSDESSLSASSDEEEDNSRKTSSGGKKVGQAGSKSGKHPQKRNFAEPAQHKKKKNTECRALRGARAPPALTPL